MDGTLTCPLMPQRLIHATTGADDATIRNPDAQLTKLITAREPYFLKLKQAADNDGKVRFQCPAAGTSPAVNCPRFTQAHSTPTTQPTRVDLTDARRRAAHSAAKPTVIPPPRAETSDLPKICTQQTITLRPSDLDTKDKFRQDLPYLSPAWQGAYKSIRASTEGINGRMKGQVIDLADPRNRLAHGRVAQTLLVALMVCIANQQILLSWRQINELPLLPDTKQTTDPVDPDEADASINGGRPPPGPN
ncbi:hypothetical protein FHR32_002742 [Streptosporangium album]|uniref:Transposase DDE domain-containing protein n=1 Tax=Streptosporangium album TaxID=47479 RepID=A0A7W7RV09_9ACTN|nr:hypothetical protein [Streptosporangium album]MBB4938437.1 hypothetical protein [Streptosporangium album]